jgi:outer membrane protein
MSVFQVLSIGAAAALMLAASAGHTLAQQAGRIILEIPAVRNYVGVGVGTIPDYFGSDNYTVAAAPAAQLRFDDSERYVRLLVTEVSVNIMDHEAWHLGPALQYRFGRDDDIDDEVVGRLDEIDGTVELGGFVSWRWVDEPDPRHRVVASARLLQDVADEHGGFVASAGLRYFRPITLPLTLAGGVTAFYGSEYYTSTYFDVTPAGAARSGLPEFDAGSGFRDIRTHAMAIFSFSPNWHVGAGVMYARMVGDAADSPIVDDRGSANQIIAGIGVGYAW